MSRKKYQRKKAYSVPKRQVNQNETQSLDEKKSDQFIASPVRGIARTGYAHTELNVSVLRNLVQVRYTKGKDDLCLKDEVSKKIITLKKGDKRTAYISNALLQKLSEQGFGFDIL